MSEMSTEEMMLSIARIVSAKIAEKRGLDHLAAYERGDFDHEVSVQVSLLTRQMVASSIADELETLKIEDEAGEVGNIAFNAGVDECVRLIKECFGYVGFQTHSS